MSFMVSQDGVVYEADLGEKSAEVAAKMMAFDPGSDWAVVK